jgi:intracellular sulfur oxidation DsrE/DsrF family protein
MLQNPYIRFVAGLATLCLLALPVAAPQAGEAASKPHRLVLQVDENDASLMNLVLNNAVNVSKYYQDKGEEVEVQIVAYGPGLHMLRSDTSPVAARVKSFIDGVPGVSFDACANTMKAMQKKEAKKSIPLIDGVKVVPSGVVTILELEEQGWSYVRP